ncbi:uncharacterized protein LOC130642255 [Hydractinia symbiolongicarpus]|uniref:uncharacterized protein LOC130642255 n=1 Tax=Hydractinia symbiolongicarpus TaxID=13093 RepID=UPI00254DECAB|nr:uncharacterized protein LOC130642255 [Hydractinia symbiolongicarpus]
MSLSSLIGHGVFSCQTYRKGDALLTYRSALLSATEANEKAMAYADDVGSYLFYFKIGNKEKRIDGPGSDCVARFVNDSPSQYANCKMMLKLSDNRPHLCLIAV